MSKPANGAARNTMSEFERQCYDWGWQDNEQRIIKLVERFGFNEELGFSFEQAKEDLLILIKGEK